MITAILTNAPACCRVRQLCNVGQLWLSQTLSRANIPIPHTVVDHSVQERRLAGSAARALDLAIANVTLLCSHQGSLVSDVSPFPPLQGWDRHAIESVAYGVFAWIELPAADH